MCLLYVLLVLPLLLMGRMSGDLSIMFRGDTDDTSGYLVMNDSFVVFANDVDTKFLGYISQNQNKIICS